MIAAAVLLAVLLAGLAARLALGAVLADLVSIGLDVERLETKDFQSERFGLTVTLENRTPVQYQYVVSLDALGMDGLIPVMPKAGRTVLTYSGNYPDSGKNGGDGLSAGAGPAGGLFLLPSRSPSRWGGRETAAAGDEKAGAGRNRPALASACRKNFFDKLKQDFLNLKSSENLMIQNERHPSWVISA